MKILFKKGSSWIIAGVAFLILTDVYGWIKPLAVNSVTSLWSTQPLMILEITAIGIMGIGVIMVLNEEYGWFKKSSDQQEKPKYDIKKLNKNIFRKLTRVEFHHDYYGNLTFKIPIDDSAFTPKNSGAYIHWIFETNTLGRDSHFSPIKNTIPDLVIGEKYLKSSYPQVYEKWEQITKLVKEHNDKHEKFLNKLDSLFEKEFLNKFPYFIEYKKVNKEDEESFKHTYILERIEQLLYRAIKFNLENEEQDSTFSRLTLHKSFHSEGYWHIGFPSSSPIIVTKDETKINIETVRNILAKIITHNDVISQYITTYSIDPKEWDKLEEFKKKLEDEVVNDIDNQV